MYVLHALALPFLKVVYVSSILSSQSQNIASRVYESTCGGGLSAARQEGISDNTEFAEVQKLMENEEYARVGMGFTGLGCGNDVDCM